MREENNWIPRNLDDPKIVKVGMGIKLRFIDLPILGGSTFLSYYLTSNMNNLTIKIVLYMLIIGGSYFLSKFPLVEDQQLPETISNSIIYTKHQLEYSQRRKKYDISTGEGKFIKNNKINKG
ncbi:MAG: hypothetical protein ACOCRK_01335 [bacterium]